MRRDDEVPPGDDERRDVDVVHADARLREHRSAQQHRRADEPRHGRRSEQPAREEHEEEREDRAEQHPRQAPGKSVASGLDEVGTAGARDEQLVVVVVEREE